VQADRDFAWLFWTNVSNWPHDYSAWNQPSSMVLSSGAKFIIQQRVGEAYQLRIGDVSAIGAALVVHAASPGAGLRAVSGNLRIAGLVQRDSLKQSHHEGAPQQTICLGSRMWNNNSTSMHMQTARRDHRAVRLGFSPGPLAVPLLSCYGVRRSWPPALKPPHRNYKFSNEHRESPNSSS